MRNSAKIADNVYLSNSRRHTQAEGKKGRKLNASQYLINCLTIERRDYNVRRNDNVLDRVRNPCANNCRYPSRIDENAR